jgi:hypothetical protein
MKKITFLFIKIICIFFREKYIFYSIEVFSDFKILEIKNLVFLEFILISKRKRLWGDQIVLIIFCYRGEYIFFFFLFKISFIILWNDILRIINLKYWGIKTVPFLIFYLDIWWNLLKILQDLFSHWLVILLRISFLN